MLAELGEVFEKRLHIERAEEHDDVVEPDVDSGKFGTLGFVHDCLFEIEFVLGKHFEDALLWRVGTGDEIFFFGILADDFEEVFNGLVAEENSALAELHILLQVIRYGFGEAEIFYVLARGGAHGGGHSEKLVNGIAACENDSGIVADIYFLFAETGCRNGFHLYERAEVNLQTVLFSKREVRRLWSIRFGLGNEDVFYFQRSVSFKFPFQLELPERRTGKLLRRNHFDKHQQRGKFKRANV